MVLLKWSTLNLLIDNIDSAYNLVALMWWHSISIKHPAWQEPPFGQKSLWPIDICKPKLLVCMTSTKWAWDVCRRNAFWLENNGRAGSRPVMRASWAWEPMWAQTWAPRLLPMQWTFWCCMRDAFRNLAVFRPMFAVFRAAVKYGHPLKNNLAPRRQSTKTLFVRDCF